LVSIHDQPMEGERYSGDEARIDVAPAYFTELAARQGLVCRQTIGNVYGQQVLLLEKPRA
jgi:hypothetical protein